LANTLYTQETIEKLNGAIGGFPQVSPITSEMERSFDGVSRLIMLDRYAFKDTEKTTLKAGDFVVFTIKHDPAFPARALGYVKAIDWTERVVKIQPEEQYIGLIDDHYEATMGIVKRSIDVTDKPLEIYYEQIAARNARGLSEVEAEEKRAEIYEEFYEELSELNFVPGGRVIYGAGSGTDVTYFNCYVMPFPRDSREGIGEHRNEVMEIMSRGGGVGTNGSTLRPRNALARGVNGKSSGSVSWLDDIAKLTHLVEQGGSRRGAQMIMLADWHPDILEFIISKMQNPRILRFIIETTNDDQIRELAQNKLKFTPLSDIERETLEDAVKWNEPISDDDGGVTDYAEQLLKDGGRYSVHNPEFLSGANISVCLTDEFMKAVEDDEEYELRFPDVENYDADQMAEYNARWHEVGDVREWPLPSKTYRTIKAKELWNLVNICATYSAEPGIFFIDNANDTTNAQAYGQKVVATNPCGEQPLAPYSVCNLAAVNLANMVTEGKVDYEKLKRTVRVGVRMQDNVIDATPYFLEANEKQALGERRLGLGVMGLADMLIYLGVTYGSEEGNLVVDRVFETIATESYRASIALAKEKGSFPFLTQTDGEMSEGDNITQQTYSLRKALADTGFVRTLPEDIREGISNHGIRNSHLLTVAPTGSTGSMVGVATGLEPYFAFKYFRSGRLGKFMEVNADIVEELGVDGDDLPDHFVSSMDLSPEAHADTQCVIQRWVDSSISKTVNAPKGYSVEQVQAVYERLYKGGAKGGTVYVDGSRDAQVLTLTAEDENGTKGEGASEQTTPPVQSETIKDLRSTNVQESEVKVGVDIGDTCPNCRKGTVIDAGGCATCNNCGVQLKCGL